MKKIVFLMALIVGTVICQFLIQNVTFAAPQNIAVVVVSADDDFKGKLFIKDINKNFGKNNANVKILSGDDVQSKYQEYWFDKELVEEGTPKKEDLIDFVSYGNYDKVIYLMIKTPDLKHSQSGAVMTGSVAPGGVVTGTAVSLGTFSTSVTVSSFLVDKDKVIKIANSTNSKVSETALWTKKYAFQKCVKDISKVLNPLL